MLCSSEYYTVVGYTNVIYLFIYLFIYLLLKWSIDHFAALCYVIWNVGCDSTTEDLGLRPGGGVCVWWWWWGGGGAGEGTQPCGPNVRENL